MKQIIIPVLLFLWQTTLFAQGSSVKMADALYQSGKIYVVVVVLLLIFIGIVAFLIRMERQVKRLEQDMEG